MTKQRARSTRVLFIVWRVATLVLFVLAAGLLTAYARGYRINPARFSFEATGAISLTGEVRDVQVMVGSELVGKKLPLYIAGLVPNRAYNVAITKTGFQTWQKHVPIEPEKIATYGPILLFRDQYSLSPVEPPDKVGLCSRNERSDTARLEINGGELRTTLDLITRVSVPIADACWFNDQYHIAYIADNKLHVVEVDGGNDVIIAQSTENLTAVAVAPDNSEIYVKGPAETWRKISLED